MSGSPFGIGEFITGQTQADAQRTAANQQADAASNSLQFQQQQAAIAQQNEQPWLDAGKNALAKQQTMLSQYPDLSTNTYQQSDYDKWIMQQGGNALSAQGAAAGMSGSGNLGTALVDYGQNQAGSQYQQWRTNTLGDYLNQYNALAGLSGTGMTTAQNMGNQQMQSAVSQGETAMSGANALAAGKIGVANAYSNALSGMGSGAGNAFNQAMSYYNQQNALYNQNQGYGYGRSADTPGVAVDGADTMGNWASVIA